MSSTYKSTVHGTTTKDVALPADDSTDTISSLRWSPAANHLATTSWDGKLHIYDISKRGASWRRAGNLACPAPLFSCDWSKDGNIVAACGADGMVHLLDGLSGASMNFPAHEKPIKGVRFVNISSTQSPIVATGSWDKNLRFWDLRDTKQPAATIKCDDRVWAMDSAAELLVVASAGSRTSLVDLARPTDFRRRLDSPIRDQITAVAVCPDGKSWATTGVQGRCALNASEVRDIKSDFSFKCHRDAADAQNHIKVWTVNAVHFHPIYKDTLATGGSDGSYQFWDWVTRSRRKNFQDIGGSITACGFSRDGDVFAYAVGYDWSRGCAGNRPDYPRKLMLHPVNDDDVKPRKGKTGSASWRR